MRRRLPRDEETCGAEMSWQSILSCIMREANAWRQRQKILTTERSQASAAAARLLFRLSP
jgi:hypothetical protein